MPPCILRKDDDVALDASLAASKPGYGEPDVRSLSGICMPDVSRAVSVHRENQMQSVQMNFNFSDDGANHQSSSSNLAL